MFRLSHEFLSNSFDYLIFVPLLYSFYTTIFTSFYCLHFYSVIFILFYFILFYFILFYFVVF